MLALWCVVVLTVLMLPAVIPLTGATGEGKLEAQLISLFPPQPGYYDATSYLKRDVPMVDTMNLNVDDDPSDRHMQAFMDALNLPYASVVDLAKDLLPTWAATMRARPAFAALRLDDLVAPPGSTDRCAVIAEGRSDAEVLPVVIKHTMHMLMGDAPTPTWSLHVFHTPTNAAQIRTDLGLTRSSRVHLVRLANLTRDAYSALLTSSVFWDALPASCEHVLIFQADVIARHRSALDAFLKYDYVGAPWKWCQIALPFCWFGGNGGVSLRRRSTMIALMRELDCSRWNCVTRGTGVVGPVAGIRTFLKEEITHTHTHTQFTRLLTHAFIT
jgi:hypothetical protein